MNNNKTFLYVNLAAHAFLFITFTLYTLWLFPKIGPDCWGCLPLLLPFAPGFFIQALFGNPAETASMFPVYACSIIAYHLILVIFALIGFAISKIIESKKD
ncbi:MAG: hypothetical protein ACI8Y7_001089 [Candidatus Woesearchaeota archaeon]